MLCPPFHPKSTHRGHAGLILASNTNVYSIILIYNSKKFWEDLGNHRDDYTTKTFVYLTILCLRFLTCQMGMIVVPLSEGCYKDKIIIFTIIQVLALSTFITPIYSSFLSWELQFFVFLFNIPLWKLEDS
jgi:hypothetical protein